MYAICGSASDVHVDQHYMYATCGSASDVCYMWISIGCMLHVGQHRMYATWISIGCMLGGCMLHVDQHRLWISIRYMLYLYKMYVTC